MSSAEFTVSSDHSLAKAHVGQHVTIELRGTISRLEGERRWTGRGMPTSLGDDISVRLEIESVYTIWTEDEGTS